MVCAAAAQTILVRPADQVVAVNATATFSVTAAGPVGVPLTYQWQRNGTPIAGATGSVLQIGPVRSEQTGIYTVVVGAGSTSTTASAILGLSITERFVGAAVVAGSDIVHANGNIYDQYALTGGAATVTADPGQVTRISYIDPSGDDIVQIEFFGAGFLSVTLDGLTGPAPPLKYNQSFSYVSGHAGIVLAGADDTTSLSVFSVGRSNAVRQDLFKDGVAYDGMADLAYIAIQRKNGKMEGLRAANANFFAARGVTGVYAPGVSFSGPLYIGDINAFDNAVPAILAATAFNVRVIGGDLAQMNGRPVEVAGFSPLSFTNGFTSHGVARPAQTIAGKLSRNGQDVTLRLTGVQPTGTIYLARLRPEAAATPSLASGYASIAIRPDGDAVVSMSYSNLSSDAVSAYIRMGAGGDQVFNLGKGQQSGSIWTFATVGAHDASALIAALDNGALQVNIASLRNPAGELVGNFVRAAGSQTFSPPALVPALPPGTLTAPTTTDAARFLTQATFGPTLAEINAVSSGGITAWINSQLALPPTYLLETLRSDAAAFPTPPNPDPNQAYVVIPRAVFNGAWWKVAVTAPDQLRQRVAFALSEILVVSTTEGAGLEGGRYQAVARYYDLLVRNAFGNYRTLLEDVSLSPCMGIFLTYHHNVPANPLKNTSPDENYAREIQQLFTIGLVQLHPDGTLILDQGGQPIPTYTQAMIAETAKVFTGWAFADAGGDFYANQNDPANLISRILADHEPWLRPMQAFEAFHDKTRKRILSLQQVAPDQAVPVEIPAGQSAAQDLKILLDTLFNHPNTGPFVCRQLIQRLVTSNPSPGYVYRVAKVFADDGTGSRGNLGAVVRAILTDFEARSPTVTGFAGYGKVKEPLIRVTALLRGLNGRAPNGRFVDGYFGSAASYGPGKSYFAYPNDRFGQEALAAPSVFNFFTPDFTVPGPLAAAGLVGPELQIIDSTFSVRVPGWFHSFIFQAPRDAVGDPTPSPYITLDYSMLPSPQNPQSLVDALNLLFCSNSLSGAARAQVLSALQGLSPGTSDLEKSRTAVSLIVTHAASATQR